MSFIPSAYQQAVFDYIATSTDPLVVQSVAGSGKTTTLLECAKRLPLFDSAIFVAFNKHIAAKLGNKLLGTPMQAQTLHSIGYRILAQELDGKLEVDTRKYYKLAKDKLEKERYYEFFDRFRNKLNDEGYELVLALSDLVGFVQKTNSFDTDQIIRHFGLPTVLYTFLHTKRTVRELIAEGERIARNERRVDYNEMIWFPIHWNLSAPKFDTIFVDECLPYKTPIHLADGTALEIGKIVEDKLQVDVLSFDTKTNKQKVCKVIGWHKILNRKPLVKIKVKWSKSIEKRNPYNFVVCTIDHKIWTNQGWIEAGKLKPDMVVQVETAAIKSQAYKITKEGRKTLSHTMAEKNRKGTLGNTSGCGSITKRGGNGKPLPLPQKLLWQALGEGWETEYTVPTKKPRNTGYPTCYKIDIANPDLMLAVEVDGESHHSSVRRAQDHKKEELLKSIGWNVLRFSNKEAVQNTDACVQKVKENDCPIDAVVVSIDPVSISDYYVYDIEVEDCHNFYANGILVHNCQDLSATQLELALKSSNGGRKVFIGDSRQAIYGFAGAANDSVQRIVERTDANELPLSICYRCDKNIISLAQEVVPQIEPRSGAGSGIVKNIAPGTVISMAKEGDLILSRKTAPLISACLDFIGNGIPAKVKGRDIGKQLTSVVKKVMKQSGYDWDRFLFYLTGYEQDEIDTLVKREATPAYIESVQDKIAAVRVCYATMKPSSEENLCAKIETLFDDTKQMIELSTVHRAKGLQAERVFIIDAPSLPLPLTGWQRQQEWNLRYVAITRAIHELYIEGNFIPGPHAQKEQEDAVTV